MITLALPANKIQSDPHKGKEESTCPHSTGHQNALS